MNVTNAQCQMIYLNETIKTHFWTSTFTVSKIVRYIKIIERI